MTQKLPPYITPSSRNSHRGRRRTRLRNIAGGLALILVAAGVIAWALLLPGGDRTAGLSTTSTTTALAHSGTSTTSTVRTTTTTTVPAPQVVHAYKAELSGQNLTPPVSTPATGTFMLDVMSDGSVHYALRVSLITDVFVARLRGGMAGAAGPVLLTVYGGPTKPGLFTGKLTQAAFTAAKLEGPLKGKPISDLEALIQAGSVYLNVGTKAHPKGEIRGQLE